MKKVILYFLLNVVGLYAHGMIHEKIDKATHEIQKSPHSSDLYLIRGKLFLENEHFAEAIKDFNEVKKDKLKANISNYFLGKIALKQKKYLLAKSYTLKYLKKLKNDNEASSLGYTQLGLIYKNLASYGKAAEAYKQSVKFTSNLQPKHFLEWIDVYLSKNKASYTEALLVVKEGEKHLGKLSVLEDKALEIECEMKAYSQALIRVDNMIKAKKRLPFLYLRKAEILKKLERNNEAKEYYILTLNFLSNLTKSRQKLNVFKNLKLQAEEGITYSNSK